MVEILFPFNSTDFKFNSRELHISMFNQGVKGDSIPYLTRSNDPFLPLLNKYWPGKLF